MVLPDKLKKEVRIDPKTGIMSIPLNSKASEWLYNIIHQFRAGNGKQIEVSIEGDVSGVDLISGYLAQAGAGSGKSYSSDDAGAITDFSEQL